jgi:GNAT superfamily N-acetyltransferase
VLLLWHGNEAIGICVFGYGPLASPARRKLFSLPGRISAAGAARVNRNFAAVTRLVIDPRYRGAGIAWRFLRRACELTPWRWIELVSEMAAVVPFCQAAGFRRIYTGNAVALPGHRVEPRRTCYGKSNWTQEGFEKYLKRVRFSRPAYFIFENKN